jgi:hypothetical protein
MLRFGMTIGLLLLPLSVFSESRFGFEPGFKPQTKSPSLWERMTAAHDANAERERQRSPNGQLDLDQPVPVRITVEPETGPDPGALYNRDPAKLRATRR